MNYSKCFHAAEWIPNSLWPRDAIWCHGSWSTLIHVMAHCLPWEQGSWGQHGAHLGPTGPMWAPCWPHEHCYLGDYQLRFNVNKTFMETLKWTIVRLSWCHCSNREGYAWKSTVLKPAKKTKKHTHTTKHEICESGLIIGLCPANEKLCYKVTSSLIGRAQT